MPALQIHQAKANSHGFTLLELLVSIAIFAVLSVMAYGGLSNVIMNNTQSQLSLERLQNVQHAVLTISRDINQITLRNIRDEFGNPQPYLKSDTQADDLIEFTRGGRRNPAQLLRSNLLRVAYRLEDEQLIRGLWTQLDRAPGSEPLETVLLDKVNHAELRYLDKNGDWHEQWPPLNNLASSNNPLIAIEFIMELNDWGEIHRLFKVGA